MAKTPDTPCSSCGRLLWWNPRTSRPKDEIVCLPCRRKVSASRPTITNPGPYGWSECPVCGALFEIARVGQRYCRAECRESRRRWTKPKAPAEQRGYGKAHRTERERWRPIVDAGQASCCLCGIAIDPGSTWHLDHTPDRTGYRGVAHASCNIRDGARRGRARQSS